jgi:dGTPase
MTMTWEKLLNSERLSNRKAKTEAGRSSFHRDHDKIIFSGAFRRLAKKTQVHPLATNDHIHNRMTHSLEVASVGRTLGIQIGSSVNLPPGISSLDIGEIVESACLAHDIGNPPFGHTGEEAIKNWFEKHINSELFSDLNDHHKKDLENFEGNAQGLRVLTTGEYHQYSDGMRLTYATLSSFIKYPWISTDMISGSRPKKNKYGVFASEQNYFHEIADKTGLIAKGDNWYCRHPLVYLMEAADDFCYGLLDLEDGVEMGIISWDKVNRLLTGILNKKEKDHLKDISKNAGISRKAAFLRGKVLERMIKAGAQAFLRNHDKFMEGEIETDLISLCKPDIRDVVNKSKKLAKDEIFNHPRKIELEIGAYAIIATLLEDSCEAAIKWVKEEKLTYRQSRIIDLIGKNTFHPDLKNMTNDDKVYQALMRVIDFISGMTDNYATYLAKQFNGLGESRY